MNHLFYPSPIQGRAALGLLVLRIAFGTAFVFHGYGKIIHAFDWMGATAPVPGFLQALAAFAEFGGGIALILGLLSTLAALGLFCTMLVALFMVHIPMGHPFVANGPGQPSYEPALVYATISFFLMLAGPGCYSLDAWLYSRCQKIMET